jgi:uncharacterized protein HemX
MEFLKNNKTVIFIILAVLAVALGLWFYFKGKKAKEEAEVKEGGDETNTIKVNLDAETKEKIQNVTDQLAAGEIKIPIKSNFAGEWDGQANQYNKDMANVTANMSVPTDAKKKMVSSFQEPSMM